MRTAAGIHALTGVVAIAASSVCVPLALAQEADRATHPAAEAQRIEKALRHGQTDAETHRLLERLGELARPSSIPLLELYTHHRRAEVRQRAYLALSRIEHPTRSERLGRGLSDPDARVREAVARALGRIGARDAVPLLFVAFERRVEGTASALGALGDDASVERFNEQLGTHPLDAMLRGYAAYLGREDIQLRTKLSIVAALGEVPADEVKAFLLRQLRSLPVSTPERLRRALRNTAGRIRSEPSEKQP